MGTQTRFLIVVMIAALVASAAPAAFAAKGSKGQSGGSNTGQGSLSLVMVNDANGDTKPNYGDTVTFNVSTTATNRPFVYLHCSQNGTQVYAASAGFFDAYLWPWERNFTLKSDYWTGGAADCTATLYYNDGKRTRNLASLSFPVAA
jgi:hypothetical protein